jgi:hypothetical protein
MTRVLYLSGSSKWNAEKAASLTNQRLADAVSWAVKEVFLNQVCFYFCYLYIIEKKTDYMLLFFGMCNINVLRWQNGGRWECQMWIRRAFAFFELVSFHSPPNVLIGCRTPLKKLSLSMRILDERLISCHYLSLASPPV